MGTMNLELKILESLMNEDGRWDASMESIQSYMALESQRNKLLRN